MTLGGVVLCGGLGSRMGEAKAGLRFGGETLLERAIARLGAAAAPLVVVAAPGQELPPLPAAVAVVRDRVAGQGPLQGIAVGLRALEDEASQAFVTAVDAPFLHPAFVRRVAALAEGWEVALPRIDGRPHPLGAVYATALHALAQALLDGGERRTLSLAERARSRWLSREELLADAELARVDPELWSLRNLNTPAELEEARRDAGVA
jgi:molybdopterin-guanine dinucleotide biosynthesis protein A